MSLIKERVAKGNGAVVMLRQSHKICNVLNNLYLDILTFNDSERTDTFQYTQGKISKL